MQRRSATDCAGGTVERRTRTYLHPDPRVLEDCGPKPLHPYAAKGFYDVTGGRHERGSLLLTSSRDLTEWPDVLNAPQPAPLGWSFLLNVARGDAMAHATWAARGSARHESLRCFPEKDLLRCALRAQGISCCRSVAAQALGPSSLRIPVLRGVRAHARERTWRSLREQPSPLAAGAGTPPCLSADRERLVPSALYVGRLTEDRLGETEH